MRVPLHIVERRRERLREPDIRTDGFLAVRRDQPAARVSPVTVRRDSR